MKLTSTLNCIRECHPTEACMKKLHDHLGGDFNPDAEFNLLTVIESNGVYDALRAMQAAIQDAKPTAASLAIKFAETSLHFFEDKYPGDDRPRAALEAARGYLDGKRSLIELIDARLGAATAASTAYADLPSFVVASYAAAAATAYAAAAAGADDEDSVSYMIASATASHLPDDKLSDIVRSVLEH